MTHIVVVVNRHRVAANKRRTDGHRDPVFRVSYGRSGKPTYYHDLQLKGRVVLRYDPARPLPCGATVWIEADEASTTLVCDTLTPLRRNETLTERLLRRGGRL